MKVLLVVCVAYLSISSAAEVDFRQRGSSAVPGGRPISVPVVHSPSQQPQSKSGEQPQPDVGQKRQLELPSSNSGAGRPSNGGASFRQQPSVPLQQPYRQPGARPSSGASASAPETPKRSSGSGSAAAISSFADQHQPAQAFVPFEAAREEQRPQRQSTAPARPLLPFPSAERKSPPPASSRGGNPEFERGFPEGFTSGLPAFDFQGRMPEPDEKSDGFMDGALNGFPNLKSFGGFDAMPEIAREDVGPQVKRQQSSFSGRPSGSRPSSQVKPHEE